jgi:hypothetical protein
MFLALGLAAAAIGACIPHSWIDLLLGGDGE